MKLNEKERFYFYGKTRIYSARQTNENYEIEFNHHYEIPDTGARPEELTINFKSNNRNFKKIKVRRTSLIKRLINGQKIDNQSGFRLPSNVNETLLILLDKYSFEKMSSDENKIELKFNGLPRNESELTTLKDIIVNLSKEIMIN